MKKINNFTEKYLNLINIKEIGDANLAFLAHLQKNHIETMSWNTIDLHLGRSIELDAEKIVDKYITETQGGVCYELNGSFCNLLKQLGYDVYLVSAKVYGFDGAEFNFDIETHTVIILKHAGQHYIVDVGWGDSYRAPALLKVNSTFSDRSGEYRYNIGQGQYQFQLEKLSNDGWKLQYGFSLTESSLTAFYPNLKQVFEDPGYQSYRQVNCIKPNTTGYLSIKNSEVIKNSNQVIEKFSFPELGGLKKILKDEFAMNEQFVNTYF